MNAEAKHVRKVLKEAGLYRHGSSRKHGNLGATRVWGYDEYVTVVPAAGLQNKALSNLMFDALKLAGFDVQRSTSGPGTTGEFDLRIGHPAQ